MTASIQDTLKVDDFVVDVAGSREREDEAVSFYSANFSVPKKDALEILNGSGDNTHWLITGLTEPCVSAGQVLAVSQTINCQFKCLPPIVSTLMVHAILNGDSVALDECCELYEKYLKSENKDEYEDTFKCLLVKQLYNQHLHQSGNSPCQ